MARDDDTNLTKEQLGAATFETLSEASFAFDDKTGVYPKRDYLNVASTNHTKHCT